MDGKTHICKLRQMWGTVREMEKWATSHDPFRGGVSPPNPMPKAWKILTLANTHMASSPLRNRV